MRGFSVAARLAATVTVWPASAPECWCPAGTCGHRRAAAGPSTGPAARRLPRQPLTTPRALPRRLYGVTVDDVSDVRLIAASSRNLPEMPITRLYLDVRQPPGHYTAAVAALRPVSYLMGELLDSSDERRISVAAYDRRVGSYLAAFGNKIDLWEIGNEVNGNWTGPYPAVPGEAGRRLSGRLRPGRRTALTLDYNLGCGDGAAELDPIAFTRKFVPPKVRNGLTYVFLSYYEGDCNSVRPSAGTWIAYFKALHTLYPHARLGFGEIGMNNPVTSKTINTAKPMINYYYGLPIRLPYYAGGYFWWYYYEDCLPYALKPLWQALRRGFEAETAS